MTHSRERKRSSFTALRMLQCCLLMTIAALSGCEQHAAPTATILDRSGSIHGLTQESFQITAQAGEVLQVVLQQSGLDLYLELIDDRAQSLGRFEANNGRYGEERAVVRVPRTGQYRVVLGAVRLPLVTGSYRVLAQSNARIDAGDLLYSDASRSDRRLTGVEIVDRFEQAAQQFAAAKRWHESGMAALAATLVADARLSDAARTIALAEQARTAFVESSEALPRATALNILGWAQVETGLKREAALTFASAEATYWQNGSAVGVQEVRLFKGDLGLEAKTPKELADKVAKHWADVASSCAHLYETVCESLAWMNLGLHYRSQGNFPQAFDRLYRAESLVDINADPNIFAHVHDNLASTHRMVGDFDQAIRHHRLSIESFAQHGECSGVSRTLHGLGYSSLGIGDVDQALRWYKLALDRTCSGDDSHALQASAASIQRAPAISSLCTAAARAEERDEDERDVALWIAWDVGNLARNQGTVADALLCHQAAMKLAVKNGHRAGTQLEYVADLMEGRDYAIARKRLAELAPQALGANNIHAWYVGQAAELTARMHRIDGDSSAAARLYAEAESIYTATQNIEGQFSALSALADLKLSSGDLGAAALQYVRADGVLEHLRLMSLDPGYRASLFATGRGIYEGWARSLVGLRVEAQERDLRTLVISERARSRLISELLKAYAVGEDSRDLRLSFATSTSMRDVLEDSEAGRPIRISDPEEVEKLKSAANLALGLDPKPFDEQQQRESAAVLRAYQRSLPQSTTVVEFMIGEARSYAWVLQHDRLARVELAEPATIRAAAAKVSELSSRRAIPEQTRAALARMHELIVRPLSALLTGSDLLIVPDDVLYEIPFAALWDAQSSQYLLQRYTLTLSPSLGFAAFRSRQAARSAPVKTALLVADPAYEFEDAARRCATRPGRRAERDGVLRRIPGSGEEGAGIAELLSGQGPIDLLTGCNATRRRVLAQALGDYRYIHFATHATADTTLPQRSAIHLARYDAGGRPVDTELTAADLFGVPLNAELVVLSGCSTGSGRRFGGEATLGLSFAMLASGSLAVVSALWPVADAAGAEAMRQLYSQLARGSSSPQALRAAQLKMLASDRWSEPHHWATYQIIGG